MGTGNPDRGPCNAFEDTDAVPSRSIDTRRAIGVSIISCTLSCSLLLKYLYRAKGDISCALIDDAIFYLHAAFTKIPIEAFRPRDPNRKYRLNFSAAIVRRNELRVSIFDKFDFFISPA